MSIHRLVCTHNLFLLNSCLPVLAYLNKLIQHCVVHLWHCVVHLWHCVVHLWHCVEHLRHCVVHLWHYVVHLCCRIIILLEQGNITFSVIFIKICISSNLQYFCNSYSTFSFNLYTCVNCTLSFVYLLTKYNFIYSTTHIACMLIWTSFWNGPMIFS